VTVSGITTPLKVAAGQSANLTAALKLTATGAANGAIKITSNAPGSPMQIAWTGTGQASVVTLSASSTKLNFGNVKVGTANTQQATVKNTGNANANISKIAVTGTGFSLNGSTSSATLTPGQSLTLSVSFDPKAVGTNTGTLTITSNATTSQLAVALTGTAAAASSSAQHSVALSWDASSSSVVGYFVYRSSKPSGPYARVNSSPTGSTSFTDTTVTAGQVYYYVVTAVSSSNIESTDSNQASVTVPSN
jgi:fibronectin type 3 domain-containing protein